jgi:putative ABC transport system substrate-binding protein
MFDMRRRDFITLIGGAAAAWPLAAGAQQSLPIVGCLAQGTPEGTADFIAAARRGIGEAKLVEGRDFAMELRWAHNDVTRLPALAADLVQRRAAVIITLDVAGARAAKAATAERPIVFAVGTDPVQAGLVASLNQPGGNVTGISSMNLDLGPKWVGLMHEMLPSAKRFAGLVNIRSADTARSLITGTQTGALTIGLQIEFVFASAEGEIEAALGALGARAQALIAQPDILFTQHRERLAALLIRERLPALFATRNFPESGGLMSYGSNFIDANRQAGIYAGRILKGEKPGDLPVQRASKFDFIINLKTAKALSLEVPQTLLATADEVIE